MTLALLFLTVAVVALLALIPTSYRLDGSGREVTCRAVVAPIVDAGLDTSGEVPFEVIEEWMIASGRDDNGSLPADVFEVAANRANELCADARAGRLGAMVLAGVIGFALSGWAALTRREPPPHTQATPAGAAS